MWICDCGLSVNVCISLCVVVNVCVTCEYVTAYKMLFSLNYVYTLAELLCVCVCMGKWMHLIYYGYMCMLPGFFFFLIDVV